MHPIFSKSFCLIFLIFTLFACNEEAEKKTKKNSAPSSFDEKIVQIEEGTQRAAIDQLARGDQHLAILKMEYEINRYQNPQKADKIKRLLTDIDKIDAETGKFIQLVDEAKFHIMKLSGEQVATAKDKSKEHVVWNFNKKGVKQKDGTDNKYGCTPARLNLYAIQAKDQYDIPMHELVGEEIAKPNPANRGMKIWKGLNGFRGKLCDIIGTYEVPEYDSLGKAKTEGAKKFQVKTKPINKFKDAKDLEKQVYQMLQKQASTIKGFEISKNEPDVKKGLPKLSEDASIIFELYKSLTKKEKFEEVNGVANVHWIGKTFDHAPLVAALASLTQLQLDALTARAKAIGHLKGRVSTGDFSFNKLVAFAGGPGVAEANSEYEVKVVLGAFDSDNQPTASLDSVNGIKLDNPIKLKASNGVAILKRQAGGETETLSGTISIRSKSGGNKTEAWSAKVGVVTSDKEATIEMPEMRVLYAGIENVLKASAGGQYKSVTLSGKYTKKKSGGGGKLYSCKPPESAGKSGKNTVRFSLKATTPSGESVSLKQSEPYTIKAAPIPTVFIAGNAKQARLSSSGKLEVRYGNEVPFGPGKARFFVKGYTLYVPGINQPLTAGSTAKIKPQHLKLMRNSGAKKFSIEVEYGGTTNGNSSSAFVAK